MRVAYVISFRRYQFASTPQLLCDLYNEPLLLLIAIYFKYLFFFPNLMSRSLPHSGVGLSANYPNV